MTEDKNNIPYNLPTEDEEIVIHGDSTVPETDVYSTHTQSSTATEQHSTHSTDESGGNGKVLRYALLAGFVIILFIISFGIVSFVPSIISSASSTASAYLFGSLFSSKPSITISFDQGEVGTGQPVTLSWDTSAASSTGQFTLSFPCTTGLTVAVAESGQSIVCGTYFAIGNSAGSIKIIPTSTNSGQTTLPFSINFFQNGSSQPKITNSSSIIVDGPGITPPSSATSTQTNSTDQNNTSSTGSGTYSFSNSNSTNTSTSSSSPQTTTPNAPAAGKSDLAIRLVSAGYMSPNGQVITNSAIPEGSRVVLQFEVSNVGSAASGSWYLTGTLPTTEADERSITSPAEPNLRPGISYLMTLAFDAFDPTQTETALTVNSSTDSNLSNNTMVLRIAESGTNYNYYNSGTYSSY